MVFVVYRGKILKNNANNMELPVFFDIMSNIPAR